MYNGHKVYFIVAVDKNFGIGKNGMLAWHLKKEMKHFKDVTLHVEDTTKQNMVLMGRTTWESIPKKFRPLKGRLNVVLTRDTRYNAEGAVIAASIEEGLKAANQPTNEKEIETIFVIGGASVYTHMIHHESLDGIYLTKIQHDYGCDVFFPDIPERFSTTKRLGAGEENGIQFEYLLITV